ncbi:hypothetical protein [Streptomyces flavalbus]|uniref:DUF1772 domain-containing protein n=1 Tax=Streptomyces flavalbus TaxID=2665155 RepID=A0ABW2WC26_9ACTN
MSHPVLALGTAVLTLAGSVWYVPAVADLRAGADRPRARRTSATACVTGWGTAALVAVLLLLAPDWRLPATAAGAGAVASAALWAGAAVEHRRLRRETARAWAQLSRGRRNLDAERLRGRRRSAAVLAVALAAAVTTATVLLTTTPAGGLLALR